MIARLNDICHRESIIVSRFIYGECVLRVRRKIDGTLQNSNGALLVASLSIPHRRRSRNTQNEKKWVASECNLSDLYIGIPWPKRCDSCAARTRCIHWWLFYCGRANATASVYFSLFSLPSELIEWQLKCIIHTHILIQRNRQRRKRAAIA